VKTSKERFVHREPIQTAEDVEGTTLSAAELEEQRAKAERKARAARQRALATHRPSSGELHDRLDRDRKRKDEEQMAQFRKNNPR